MINDLRYIKQKTIELEENIQNISKDVLKKYKTFQTINKNLLNFSVVSESEIELAKLDLTKGESVCLFCKINFYLQAKQTIEISLIANNISISKAIKNFDVGENEFSLIEEFSTLISSENKISLSIKSLDEKQIEISNIKLLIYGLEETKNTTKYKCVDCGENILLLFSDQNEVYYLQTPKNLIKLNSQDFMFYTSAICYDICNTGNQNLFFRVDPQGNLTYSIFGHNNETFIDDNVSAVSSTYGDNKTIIAYVKKNACYISTIENNAFGLPEKLAYSNIKNTLVFYNKFNNKFYLILSDENNQNYILESERDKLSYGENLNASYTFLIETYRRVDDET